MSTTIKIKSLSSREFEKAIKKVEKYKKDLVDKSVLFCKEIIALGEIEAKVRIGESPLGHYIVVTTSISPSQTGCKAMLMAVGAEKSSEYGTINTLMMVEFGAGIYHNSIANPKADEFGYGVGTFPNQKHAFENGWWYPKDDGTWGYTHGTKATMPMYGASTKMLLNIERIARKVFKS